MRTQRSNWKVAEIEEKAEIRMKEGKRHKRRKDNTDNS